MPGEQRHQKATIFLAGFSQGGTTLLLSLLDGHPEVFVYPDEPHFSKIFLRSESYVSAKHMWTDSLMGTPNTLLNVNRFPVKELKQKQRAAVPPDQVDDAYDAWSGALGTGAPQGQVRGLKDTGASDDFINAYLSELHKMPTGETLQLADVVHRHLTAAARAQAPDIVPSRFAFKEPIHDMRHLNWLDAFLQMAPESRVVFLTRHPLARLSSMMRFHEKLGRNFRLSRNPIGFLRLAHKNARDYRLFRLWAKRQAQNPSVLILGFEDLVAAPQDTLRDFADWAGIRFDDKLLSPTKLGAPVKVLTDRTRGDGSISASNVDAWRANLSLAERGLQSALLRLHVLGSDVTSPN